MNTEQTAPDPWAREQERNTRILGYWTLLWVASLALAVFGPLLLWQNNTALSIAAVAFNIAMGIGMIFAHKRYLNGQDELHRKISLEAMALSLGVGLVIGLAYSTLDIIDVITADAEISYLVMLMSVVYGAGLMLGRWKYR